MIAVLRREVTEEQIERVCQLLTQVGCQTAIWQEVECTVVGAMGAIDPPTQETLIERLNSLPFVERVARPLKPYKPAPARAFSGGPQSLIPARFSELVRNVTAIAEGVGRRARGAASEGVEERCGV